MKTLFKESTVLGNTSTGNKICAIISSFHKLHTLVQTSNADMTKEKRKVAFEDFLLSPLIASCDHCLDTTSHGFVACDTTRNLEIVQ